MGKAIQDHCWPCSRTTLLARGFSAQGHSSGPKSQQRPSGLRHESKNIRLWLGEALSRKPNPRQYRSYCWYIYVKLGHFSTKSDAYSFGILVLEIVTGRKCCSFDCMNLQSVAWDYWSNGTAMDLVDPVMGDQWSRDEVLNCIQIALMYVQKAAADRPSMSEVITMFSSYTVTIPPLSKPAFYVSKEIVESFGSNPVHESTAAASQPRRSLATECSQQSINVVTITDVDGR